MRFSKYCPTHGRPPGWVILDEPIKRVFPPIVENGEIVVKVKYAFCKCVFETRAPFDGIHTKNNYVYVNTPDGYKPRYRFVWEQAHGKIPEGYVIHHINGMRQDDRLENLIALPREKHNNNMPVPFEIECPNCKRKMKLIKQRNKVPIILS